MIAVVDYGLGNVHAFISVYKKLNVPVLIANDSNVLLRADKIILPGVGAFDYAMDRLNNSGMRSTLDYMVLEMQKPVLGVCVGMQMMASGSDEGISPGLGWIDGRVKKIKPSDIDCKINLPHMGWNNVSKIKHSNIFSENTDSRFYFLHSYSFYPQDESCILATSRYHLEFPSMVNLKNIYGVQFHPEKSHHWGIQLLNNFSLLP